MSWSMEPGQRGENNAVSDLETQLKGKMMNATIKLVPRRTSPRTGDAIWMKFECGAGSRWTSTTEDSTGKICDFSGCNCGTVVKFMGDTDDRGAGWFGLRVGGQVALEGKL